VTDKCRKVE